MSPTTTTDDSLSTPQSDLPKILSLRKALTKENTPLAQRFRALFALKHFASLSPPTSSTLPSIRAMAAAFASPSALLKHEVAYCLGQTGNLATVPYLRTVLEDEREDPMCRHEAAEALGALGDSGSLDLLKMYRDKVGEKGVVRETCEIAVERIEWQDSEVGKLESLRKSDFSSIDPAPPLAQTEDQPHIPDLQKALLDIKLPLFQRYRAMFALRDLACPPNIPSAIPAIYALAAGFSDPSALFRHEVAFVFGQLSHPASIPSLVAALSNTNEEGMVRHEAAEALGGLGNEEGVEDILKGFLNDSEQVVRESIVVALDMAEFEKNGDFQYAGLPVTEEFSPMAAVKA